MVRSTRVPRYRLHKASGRGVVTLRGRAIYLPGTFDSTESRAAYRKVIVDLLGCETTADLAATFTEQCLPARIDLAADRVIPW